MIEEAVKKLGRRDILVNKTIISGVSKVINEISANNWNHVIDVNLKRAFLCSREALRYILQNIDSNTNNTGTRNNCYIINVLSAWVYTTARFDPFRCIQGRDGDGNEKYSYRSWEQAVYV